MTDQRPAPTSAREAMLRVIEAFANGASEATKAQLRTLYRRVRDGGGDQ